MCSPLIRVLRKVLPILTWLPEYNLTKAFSDVLAGLTVGLTVIPQSIAFAFIAELPPQYGLYSSFMSSFVYIAFGTVREVTVGPTTLMALMSLQFTSLNVGYAPLLALVNGLVILAIGMLRLGSLVNFVSIPVISGFTSAASITIMSNQLKSLLGLDVIVKSTLPAILKTYEELYGNASSIRWQDSLLGISCIMVLIAMKQLPNWVKNRRKTIKKIAWFISIGRNAIVVVTCSLLAYSIDPDFGSSHKNTTMFTLTGTIKAGLPSVSLPPYGIEEGFWNSIKSLGSLAFTLPLVAILGQIAIAKSHMKGKPLKASQELVALGVANLAGSLVSSMPVNASFGRSAVNKASGVCSPMGGLTTGALVILALTYLMPFCAFIPKATLAAVVICAVLFTVDYEVVLPMWRAKSEAELWKTYCTSTYFMPIAEVDLVPLFATFFACALWRLDFGILLGVGVNFVGLMYHSSKPCVSYDENGEEEELSSRVATVSCCVMYPGATHMRECIEKNIATAEVNAEANKSGISKSQILVDLRGVHVIDFTAATSICNLFEDYGDRVTLLNVKPEVKTCLAKLSDKVRFVDSADEQYVA